MVDCFGPTDLVKMIDVQYGKQHTKENLLFTLGGGTEDSYQDVLNQISPINYVEKGRDLPPFLILHGDADPVVLFEDSEAFYNKLVENGYQADLVRVTDAPHEGNFWSMQLLEIAFQFIEKHIGG